MSDKGRHINDAGWMRRVRVDLDSDPEVWVVKPQGQSKANAIGRHLDIILTEQGYPPGPRAPHLCSVCGKEHRDE